MLKNHLDLQKSQLITRSGRNAHNVALASFTAEALLMDRPKIYGLKGFAGFAAWIALIVIIMSGPIQTSAYSDLSGEAAPVCRAH